MNKFALKSGLALLLLCATGNIFAQEEKEPAQLPKTVQHAEDNHVFYDRVYAVDNAPKKELYKRVQIWMSEMLKPEKNSTAADDKDNDYINTTALLYSETFEGCYELVKVSVHFKDNKVRLECISFIHHDPAGWDHELGTLKGPGKKLIFRDFDKRFASLLQSFETAIKKDTQGTW